MFEETVDRFRRVARERTPQTAEEPRENESREDPREGGDDLPRPMPTDPPDNASLPGDPSVTRPDF